MQAMESAERPAQSFPEIPKLDVWRPECAWAVALELSPEVSLLWGFSGPRAQVGLFSGPQGIRKASAGDP